MLDTRAIVLTNPDDAELGPVGLHILCIAAVKFVPIDIDLVLYGNHGLHVD